MPESTPIIDMESALERTGGDSEFLDELLDLYVSEFPTQFERLSQSIQGLDMETVRTTGHSLKGSSANLSLLQLQDLSRQMEIAGREKDQKQAEELLNRLLEQFERLKNWLGNR